MTGGDREASAQPQERRGLGATGRWSRRAGRRRRRGRSSRVAPSSSGASTNLRLGAEVEQAGDGLVAVAADEGQDRVGQRRGTSARRRSWPPTPCGRRSSARAKARVESGSASWASTVRSACSAAAGSQGVPVVKPEVRAAAPRASACGSRRGPGDRDSRDRPPDRAAGRGAGRLRQAQLLALVDQRRALQAEQQGEQQLGQLRRGVLAAEAADRAGHVVVGKAMDGQWPGSAPASRSGP